jgi:hypothetical protein
MKDDPQTISAPTGAIDWATERHTGVVVDHTGDLVADYTFAHTRAGLAAMLRRFARHGVERVAIERPDGPVVDTLLVAGFTVFVIPPRQKDLVQTRVALTNQLRASLHLVLPGAVGLFSKLNSPISLAWLRRFTTQRQVDWLSPVWRCWQDHTAYDTTHHGGYNRLRIATAA